MNRFLRIVAICASLGATTHPAAAAPKTWKQEPSSFLKIDLGKKFDPPFKTCDVDDSGAPCVDASSTYSPTTRIVRKIPLAISDIAEVGVFQGTTAAIRIAFTSDKFDSAISMLSAKYGKPHTVESRTAQNGFGAKFNYKRVIWEGKHVIIKVDEASGELGWSIIAGRSQI